MPEPDPLPAIKTPWDSATPPTGAGTGEAAPIPIPDHTILRRIGKGSYGEVWLARNALGVYRAVKIIHRGSFDDARPFEREFAGMQRFEPVSRSHESQLNILQVGRGPDCFYYVMELADDMGGAYASGGTSFASPQLPAELPSGTSVTRPSETLNPDTYTPRNLRSELLLRGRLPVDECVRLGLALTTALEHLHRHGLVHRDIKPSNIVFVNGIPKLADIGLVAQAEATMSFVGTEGYLPPEGPGTVPADLFSLGKVLYEISTGRDRQQFPELPTGIAELPDRAALAELNEVLLRACAPDVKQRYESAAEMHADLALLQSGKSVSRMRTVERRLKFVARAGAVVTGIAVLAGAAFFYQQLQTREARRLASENQTLADENQTRLAQLHTAEGIRQMDRGDLGAAMVSIAEALKSSSNNPARTEEQRFRLANLLALHPKPVAVLRLNTGVNPSPRLCRLSQDGRRMLAKTGGGLELWDLALPPRRLFEIPDPADWNGWSFAPDGRRFCAISSNRLAQLWTERSGGQWNKLELTGSPLTDAFFVGSGEWLAGFTTNGNFVRFNAVSGKADGPPLVLGPTVKTEFSQLGDWCALADESGEVRCLDLMRRELFPATRIAGKWSTITPVLGGRHILAVVDGLSGGPHRAQLFDRTAGRAIGLPLEHWQMIGPVEFDLRMTRAFTAGGNGVVRAWSMATGDAMSPPLPHSTRVVSIAPSRDGTRLATSTMDGMVRIWDLASGRQVAPPLFHASRLLLAGFAGGDSLLVTAGDDGLLRMWDLASPESTRFPLALTAAPGQAAMSPDGEMIAAFDQGITKVWSLKSFERLCSIPARSGRSACLRFSPDSAHLAISESELGARVWNPRTGEPSGAALVDDRGIARDFSFSPDGTELAVAEGQANSVRFWDWRQGKESRPSLALTNAALAARWSPKGDRLFVATATDRGVAEGTLWDLASRKPLTKPMESTRLGEFSPDGGSFVLVGAAGNAVIFNATTGRPEGSSLMHLSSIIDCRWSPDGRRLITGSKDRTSVVWDAKTGARLFTLTVPEEAVHRVSFTGDGHGVITQTESGRVRLWSSTSGEPLTPWVDFGVRSSFLHLHPTRPLLVADAGSRMIVQEFATAPPGSSEMLLQLAGLVSGRATAGAAGEGFDTDHWLALYDAFLKQHPEVFNLRDEALSRWHENAAAYVPVWGAGIEGRLFHLDRLIELHPERSELRRQRVELAQSRIPPRSADTAARLIDLTDVYTDSFGTLPNHDLDDLPRGLQRLAGTDFDIRGMVYLRNPESTTRLADGLATQKRRVGHIGVGQTCRRLQFLQASEDSDAAKAGVACRYRVCYADGMELEVPMVLGSDLGDWWTFPDNPLSGPRAAVAWRGHCALATARGAVVELFKATWQNPRPEVAISHLSFELGDIDLNAFVVAITAE